MNANPPSFVIRRLRQLVPRRQLRPWEARRIVELQANRLRDFLDVRTPDLAESAITTLPRIRVAYEPQLPVSGATAWHNGCWLILINSLEDFSRQRFSLAHELFHVINYPTLQWLLPGQTRLSPQAERLADYFGGCLLAPKGHLLRLYGEDHDVHDLAAIFGMSARAVRVRLDQLHVIDSRPRCGRPVDWSFNNIVPTNTEAREVSHG